MNNEAQKIARQIESFERMNKEALAKIGDITKAFFIESFDKQGFTDEGFDGWEPDKNGKTEKILVKSGRLKGSIKVESITQDEVKVTSDVPYARYVNEGTRRMPKREFMGHSAVLDEKVKKIIDNDVKQAFK